MDWYIQQSLQVLQVVMVPELQHILLQLLQLLEHRYLLLGSVSTRMQGAGTVTYAATATNTTGITYTLDAASIAGGNTINAATGAVTYAAAWMRYNNNYCKCCRLWWSQNCYTYRY